MMNIKSVIFDKRRGKFLSTVIIFNALFGSWWLMRHLSTEKLTPTTYFIYPAWHHSFTNIMVLLSLVLLIFIFFWKKWAVYVSAIKLIIVSIVDFVIVHKNPQYTGHAFDPSLPAWYYLIAIYALALIFFIVFYWSIQRRWEYFA